MAELEWDKTGERTFETGLDRGVLYTPNHLVEVISGDPFSVGEISYQGFPWNGLVSVDDNPEGNTSSPIYFDGKKVLDLVSEGDFAASIKAITYPDEFMPFDGFHEHVPGMYLDNQPRQSFGLSYRTVKGNDLAGIDLGYKIHILYNLTAVSDAVSYQTMGSNVDPIIFGWNITSKSEIAPGYRPTAHIVLDSEQLDPNALLTLEDILYGTVDTEARLPSIEELIYYTSITITDNGDGTWSAEGPDYFISMLDINSFQITEANAIYLNSDSYQISSTYD